MLKIIAVRYFGSRIIGIKVFDSLSNGLGYAEEENADLLRYGMFPQWSVFVVDGQNWFRQENDANSWARYEFIEFLRSVGGSYAGFDVENFMDPARKDF